MRTSDGITVVAVGAGGSAFNSAWVTVAPVDPESATSWAFATPLESAGLTDVATMPGMVRDATTDVPALTAGLRVETVRDEVALRRHRAATAIGFGAPEPHSLDVVMPSTLLDDERVLMFNGH